MALGEVPSTWSHGCAHRLFLRGVGGAPPLVDLLGGSTQESGVLGKESLCKGPVLGECVFGLGDLTVAGSGEIVLQHGRSKCQGDKLAEFKPQLHLLAGDVALWRRWFLSKDQSSRV